MYAKMLLFMDFFWTLFSDVSRNFIKVEEILKIINIMSMYKMNKLHLHLSDDEGWRLEIPGIPELTQVTL
jgi:hexosaminidase